MNTSRLVRFWISAFSLSISAPLRPMMMPGRAVRMMRRSLLPGRSTSTELTPAGFSFSGSSALQLDVFDQQLVIVALDEPARLPRLVHTEAESIRMDFLSHSFPLLCAPDRLSRRAVCNFYFNSSRRRRIAYLAAFLVAVFFAAAFLAGAFFAAVLLPSSWLTSSLGSRVVRPPSHAGLVLLGHGHDDVSEAPLIAEGASLRGRPDALHARTRRWPRQTSRRGYRHPRRGPAPGER